MAPFVDLLEESSRSFFGGPSIIDSCEGSFSCGFVRLVREEPVQEQTYETLQEQAAARLDMETEGAEEPAITNTLGEMERCYQEGAPSSLRPRT
jgi:hypothetical protein